jgi:hypothetical protein
MGPANCKTRRCSIVPANWDEYFSREMKIFWLKQPNDKEPVVLLVA